MSLAQAANKFTAPGFPINDGTAALGLCMTVGRPDGPRAVNNRWMPTYLTKYRITFAAIKCKLRVAVGTPEIYVPWNLRGRRRSSAD
jgi:hypothetical protein